MLAEVPYGQECPNDSRIKKTSYKMCETCGFRKFLGKTFATCSWGPQASSTEKMTQEERAIIRTFNDLHYDAHLCPKCREYMIIPGYVCFGCGYDGSYKKEKE